ncbi:uncharacterized protein LOC143215165 [Lasioglossum baleicum]|uniref:uncharacterized protein LOC143215165 n=1 Tax=Lasioglossum baleicum TaxID=434251 RepID=UPI003FCEBF99
MTQNPYPDNHVSRDNSAKDGVPRVFSLTVVRQSCGPDSNRVWSSDGGVSLERSRFLDSVGVEEKPTAH